MASVFVELLKKLSFLQWNNVETCQEGQIKIVGGIHPGFTFTLPSIHIQSSPEGKKLEKRTEGKKVEQIYSAFKQASSQRRENAMWARWKGVICIQVSNCHPRKLSIQSQASQTCPGDYGMSSISSTATTSPFTQDTILLLTPNEKSLFS